MEYNINITTEDIVNGLKHYRRIAKQDLLRAVESPNPEAFAAHAECRREVYSILSAVAQENGPQAAVEHAIKLYQALPFLHDSQEDGNPQVRGQENAIENFFLMVNLENKVRREARKMRSTAGNS